MSNTGIDKMGKNWRRGKSKNLAVTKSNATSKRLTAMYLKFGTWDTVAREIGISKAMAYRVAHGYEPRRAHIRAALGLPCFALAPACTKCGVVHVTKKCTANHKPARRAYSYTEYPVWTLSDLADLARAQPDARVVVLGVGAEFERVRVGWQR